MQDTFLGAPHMQELDLPPEALPLMYTSELRSLAVPDMFDDDDDAQHTSTFSSCTLLSEVEEPALGAMRSEHDCILPRPAWADHFAATFSNGPPVYHFSDMQKREDEGHFLTDLESEHSDIIIDATDADVSSLIEGATPELDAVGKRATEPQYRSERKRRRSRPGPYSKQRSSDAKFVLDLAPARPTSRLKYHGEFPVLLVRRDQQNTVRMRRQSKAYCMDRARYAVVELSTRGRVGLLNQPDAFAFDLVACDGPGTDGLVVGSDLKAIVVQSRSTAVLHVYRVLVPECMHECLGSVRDVRYFRLHVRHRKRTTVLASVDFVARWRPTKGAQ